jgi:hypothetical protein
MAASDYLGRTADICTFHGAKPGETVLLRQSFFPASGAPGGTAVVGLQKLVQRFLVVFNTPRGSVLLDEDWGTDFYRVLYGSVYRTRSLIERAFAQAALQARQILVDEEFGLPDDERFTSATLTDVVFNDNGSISLSIRLVSRAGESYLFIEPLALMY